MRALRVSLTALTLGLALAGVGTSAHAGLFSDDEARKAIVDLRAQVQQLEESVKARLEQLQAQAQEQNAPLRRSLLDLSAQLETLRAELARLRGQNEQLARDLAETQRKLLDQTQQFDSRLKGVEPQKVTVDGREFAADPDEKRLYDAALGELRKGSFAEAIAGFNTLLKRFPSTGYTDSARFWMGNAQYGKRDFRDAIVSFRAMLASSPDHPKAPEALLAIANCQMDLKDNKAARKTLEDILKAYPGTETAKVAKEALRGLR